MIAAAWIGVSSWRQSVVERQRERAETGVQGLMAEARWLEARGAVRAFWRDFGHQLSTEEQLVWRELDLETSEKAGDLTRLVWLESRYPELVLERESASLLITRTFAAAGQLDDADRVREAWRGREASPELWLSLDVDRLLAVDRVDDARALLESVTFAGKADLGRQLRRALMAPTPRQAWDALNAAVLSDPENPDARSFRAQILERTGAIEAARVEYVAALVANPADPVRRDQLAQFYRRHGGTAQALQTWRDGLTATAPDFFWLRTLLWERLFGGSAGSTPAAPPGVWSTLIEAMSENPSDRFWSDELIANPADARLAAERPEVELLTLLEHLRNDREADALEMVVALGESTEMLDAVGTAALRIVLRWRATELEPDHGDLPVLLAEQEEHVLMQQVRNWPSEPLSDDTRELLAGPHAWPALMLAAGWPRAAIIMAGDRIQNPVTEAPGWFHYGMAVALRQNQGAAAASTYLAQAPDTPALQLLAAEIAWGEGDSSARNQLSALAGQAGNVGYRAAWLLAVDALGRDDWDGARRWIDGQPELATGVTGRELLARTALQSNRPEQAAKIYQELGPESLEAGMYLARVAFTAGDWARARELTENLIADYPSQLELRRNLDSISEAEAAAENSADQ